MSIWTPRLRRLTLDWAAPAAIVVVGIVDILTHTWSIEFPGAPAPHLVLLTMGAALLGLRRRAPILAPGAAIAVATGWAAMWPDGAQGPFEGFLVLVGAAYCIAAGNRGRRLVRGTAVLVIYFVLSQLALLVFGGSLGDLLPVVVWMLAGWAVGLVLNRRTDQATEARAQAAALIVEQERRTTEAVEQERSRIARELHDVVAHSLSVIVVQAAAERRAISHGRYDPSTVEGVLASVEQTGREALVDLRRLLGLLRQIGEPPSLDPQPSLKDLDLLVDQVREAGVAVSVEVTGEAASLPAGVDLTAYRIVQESLTNVLKHARASHVDVRLHYRTRALEIEVCDDGGTTTADSLPVGGHGLLGMRERTTLFGGSVAAGPGTAGGWRVHATLPLEPTALEPA